MVKVFVIWASKSLFFVDIKCVFYTVVAKYQFTGLSKFDVTYKKKVYLWLQPNEVSSDAIFGATQRQ